jgi:FkbM family methyltransferase
MNFFQKQLSSIIRRITRRRRFPLLLRRRGANFVLDPRNWIDSLLARAEPFENELIARAANIMAAERRDIFIDVGANLGLYTVLLGKSPSVKRVIAFEPVRRNFNQLMANVFVNRLDQKVDAFRLALGDTTQDAIIHIDPTSTGASYIDNSDGAPAKNFSIQEVISVVPADTIISLERERLFIKIDAEGHASAALRGMQKLLANNDAVLQIEVFPKEREAVTDILDGLGYQLVESFGVDCHFRRKMPAL